MPPFNFTQLKMASLAVEFFALNESKESWINSTVNIEKSIGTMQSITYLLLFFVYDIVCMAIKRCLIKRSGNNFFKHRGKLCLESPKIIQGDLDGHELSVMAYHEYNGIKIAFYSQSGAIISTRYRASRG